MVKMKRIVIIAFVLIIVGITGSIVTFKSMKQAAGLIMEKKVIDAELIKDINIITNNTRVDVVSTTEAELKVELSGGNTTTQVETDVKGETLSIQVRDKQGKFINLDIFPRSTTLTVYVPEKVYGSLQMESDNGRISVENVQVKDINVKTDNGRIVLKDIESTSVIGEADNGRIELSDVSSSTTKVRASNGKIILDHVTGELVGETNNGSMKLITEDLDRPIDFKTDNGKIHIQTEQEPTNATFDVRVSNGKVRIFEESNWDTVIGDGEYLIKLTTSNGGITVTK